MEYVATNNAPGAIGPYSQAVKANGFLFTSGQIAINPATNTVEAKTIEEQTTQVCENLKAVVEAAGLFVSLPILMILQSSTRFTANISHQSRLVHALP